MANSKPAPDPMNIALRVTLAIIARATRGSTTRCLVAMALREWAVLKGLDIWSINVTNESVRFNMNHTGKGKTGVSRYIFATPPKAAVLLSRWDENEKMVVKPFRFTLRAATAARGDVNKKGPVDRPYKKRDKNAKRPASARRCKRRHAGMPIMIAGAVGHKVAAPVRKRAA